MRKLTHNAQSKMHRAGVSAAFARVPGLEDDTAGDPHHVRCTQFIADHILPLAFDATQSRSIQVHVGSHTHAFLRQPRSEGNGVVCVVLQTGHKVGQCLSRMLANMLAELPTCETGKCEPTQDAVLLADIPPPEPGVYGADDILDVLDEPDHAPDPVSSQELLEPTSHPLDLHGTEHWQP
jgi:hypothetical protein